MNLFPHTISIYLSFSQISYHLSDFASSASADDSVPRFAPPQIPPPPASFARPAIMTTVVMPPPLPPANSVRLDLSTFAPRRPSASSPINSEEDAPPRMDASSILDDSVFVTADGTDNPAFNTEEYGYTPAVPSRAAPRTADAATSITRPDDEDDGEGEVEENDNAFSDDDIDDNDDDFDDDDDDEELFMDVAVYERVLGRKVDFPPPPPPLETLNKQPVQRIQLESSSSF